MLVLLMLGDDVSAWPRPKLNILKASTFLGTASVKHTYFIFLGTKEVVDR